MTFPRISTDALEYQIDWRDTVTSTMDEVSRVAGVIEEGYVVVADVQTQGRGRNNRKWLSSPGDGLLFSLLLKPDVEPKRLSLISLMSGLAVAEAIETFANISIQLKWPNDVLYEGKKLAGILLTSKVCGGAAEHVVLGIGINVDTAPDLPDQSATSIREATSLDTDREALLEMVLTRFADLYRNFFLGNDEWHRDWNRRAWLRGERISVHDNGRVHEGIFVGIDPLGGLQLRVPDNRLIVIASGEMAGSVRATDSRVV